MKKTVFVVLALALVALVAAAGCISTPEEPASPVGIWLVPGQDVELLLTPDGSYWGTAQVNLFSGSYTVDGDKLTFGEPVRPVQIVATVSASIGNFDVFYADFPEGEGIEGF